MQWYSLVVLYINIDIGTIVTNKYRVWTNVLYKQNNKELISNYSLKISYWFTVQCKFRIFNKGVKKKLGFLLQRDNALGKGESVRYFVEYM